jgi:class I fructose-bisphosphate aldolase
MPRRRAGHSPVDGVGLVGNPLSPHDSACYDAPVSWIRGTLEADIIKQKLPIQNGGYKALNAQKPGYGKYDERMYTELCTARTIPLI